MYTGTGYNIYYSIYTLIYVFYILYIYTHYIYTDKYILYVVCVCMGI